METAIDRIYSGYNFINSEISDPRTTTWPLVGSPWPILTVVGLYLYFVNSLGPRLMENVQPFRIERIMIVYNLFQIAVNLYIFYMCTQLGWVNKYSWLCEPVDYSDDPDSLKVASITWLYFIVKVTDLLDTVFFVLRKKNSQITFLHVYHHAAMVIGTWIAAKYLPGGHGTFVGFLNTFVHVIMYTYYLMTIVNPEYKKSIWWKKHITQLQMTQFMMITVHASQLLFRDCGYPQWVGYIVVPQNAFMFVLFYDFYRKAYCGEKKNV
ncbi:elongation of very long chain fatty acids protein AAEL008004-like [Schistocerca serialis cubense]|uniref:elongation of very long chain fatty acids protein AAEL008004-like n=1 Tax=Schistocerca serialis cubense TaxID=2023355 RepID=UPI00214F1C2A|nr:elongation of very long chain fatty acids protein AAEL008004-like [Schistocerca serialis cubense]